MCGEYLKYLPCFIAGQRLSTLSLPVCIGFRWEAMPLRFAENLKHACLTNAFIG